MPVYHHNLTDLSPHDEAVVIPLEAPPFVNHCKVAHHLGLVIVKDIAATWHEALVEPPLLVLSVVTPLVLIGWHPTKAVVAPEVITSGDKLETLKP